MSKLPRVLRKSIIKRDGGCCKICGTTQRLTVHHIDPICYGGSDNPSNLVTLCKECHNKITFNRFKGVIQVSILIGDKVWIKRQLFPIPAYV